VEASLEASMTMTMAVADPALDVPDPVACAGDGTIAQAVAAVTIVGGEDTTATATTTELATCAGHFVFSRDTIRWEAIDSQC
jgi:hypothetical protein